MRQKIFKTGDNLVVSLPKELLEPLGMDDGSIVSIELDRKERQILIRAAAPEMDKKFARLVDEFIQEYRSSLEALAQ
jgi:antitoxin MazE